MDDYTLLESLFGAKRAEGGTAHMETATMTGVAVEDSDGGQVRIIPDGHVAAAEGEDNTIIIPTSPNVEAGDTVLVSMTGGVSKSPMVIGAKGAGDRVKADIDDFKEYADVTYTHETEFDEVTGAISNTITANYSATAPNISPFFSFDEPAADSITNDYWARYAANPSANTRNASATVTPLSDGWLHIVKTAGTSNVIFAPKAQPFISANGKYTLLFEFKNVTVSGTNRMQIANVNYGQLCATGTSYYFQVAEGMQRFVFPSDGLEIRSTNNELVRFNLNSALVVTCDMRVSLYEGEYLGGYKPYSLSKADAVKEYATRSYVSQTADAIELEVSQTYLSQADASTTYATKSALEIATDSISSLVQGNATYTDPVSGQTVTSALGTQVTQNTSDVSTLITDVGGIQTIIRETADGILVAKAGNTVGALVNADGSFDVVELSWSGDTPTAGTVLSSFSDTDIEIGIAPVPELGTDTQSRILMNGGCVRIVDTYLADGEDHIAAIQAVTEYTDQLSLNAGDAVVVLREGAFGDFAILGVENPNNNNSIVAGVHARMLDPTTHEGALTLFGTELIIVGSSGSVASNLDVDEVKKLLQSGVAYANLSYLQNGAHFETDDLSSSTTLSGDISGKTIVYQMKFATTSNVSFSGDKIAQIARAADYPCESVNVPVFSISSAWTSPVVGWLRVSSTDGGIYLWTPSAVSAVFGQIVYVTS